MTNKRRTILITISVILLMTVVGITYWTYISSPQYSLNQISKSFREHDLTTFQKYVDSDGIINNLFDQQMDLLTEYKQNGEKGLGEEFAKGLVTLMRPQVIETLKRQTNKLIEAGNFDKSDTIVQRKDPFTIAEIWNKGGNKNNITGIREIKKDGKIATVVLELRQERFDTTLLFNMKMRDKGNYWQLSELTDFKTLALTLEELERIRVDKINKPTFDKISETITISDFKIAKSSDYWGIDKKFKISMGIKNIGEKPITEYFLLVGFSNDTGMDSDNDKMEIKHDNGLIEPMQTQTWTWTTRNTFYESASEEFSVNLETQFIKFQDGTELRILKKWEN